MTSLTLNNRPQVDSYGNFDFKALISASRLLDVVAALPSFFSRVVFALLFAASVDTNFSFSSPLRNNYMEGSGSATIK